MPLLLNALGAADLHFETTQRVRSTLHPVVGFNWQGRAVRVLLNPFNHLPDAVETVAVFYDHWYQWGDVHQRIYWDNWQTVHGLRYPTNEVEERNGTLWESRQVLRVDLNPAMDAAVFKMDAQVAQEGLQSAGWERPFKAQAGVPLAPGITLFPGSWNATVVRQDDGIVLLESARTAWSCTHCAAPPPSGSTWCISRSISCCMPATRWRSTPMAREVMDAVKRENLEVTTVFAMHQEPVPWQQVSALVERALN